MNKKLIDRTDEWHKLQEALKKPFVGNGSPPPKEVPTKPPEKETK